MSRHIIKDIKTPNGDAIIDEVNDAVRVNIAASAGSIAVTGPLTDAELRATPVPVSGTVSATLSEPISVDDNGGSLTVDGSVSVSNFPATQAISAAALPLPTGAATSALQTQPGVDIGDVTVNNAAGAAAVNIQDGGNSITVDGSITASVSNESITPTAVTASASGDNTIFTPTGGTSARVYYVSLSADGGNSADVTAIVKFGAGGTSRYKVSLKAGSIWARNIGAGRKYMQGAVNEAVIVNLSAAQSVHTSIESESV